MYTIIIADDENVMRRGISKTIEDYGKDKFKVIAMAKNGKDGLESIKKYKPDIILSDIRMPLMTGLEMIEASRNLGIYSKVIFLSGFGEFEYVKSAINLKVETYLLKPVPPQELMNILNDIAKKISEENVLTSHIIENMPVMKQKFFSDLLVKHYKDDDYVESELKFYNIPIIKGDFLVLIFKIDDYNNKDYIDEIMENQLCKYAIFNISTELLSNTFKIVSYYSENDEFTIIINYGYDEEKNLLEVYNVCYNICEKVEQHLKTTVTIALGKVFSGFSGISKSYSDALNSIEHRHILGRNRIITMEDVKLLDKIESEDLELNSYEDRLIADIKLCKKERARALLKDIQNMLIKDKFSLNQIRIIAIQILTIIIKEISNWSSENSKIFQKNFHLVSAKINSLNTIYDIFGALSKTIDEIIFTIDNEHNTQQKLIVEQAIKYIEKNYHMESLSLSDVASRVHINSSYLSTLFKKETNENFIDYLTRMRMEKAQMLLRNETLKAYEISNAIGYSNPQYFSLCFKKFTGYSPLQYKNIVNNSGK